MQKLLDDRKNWTLLTPEEILGVPTPEKILGVPMADDQKNLTATERYLKRMDQNSQSISATNALQGAWLSLDSTQNDLSGSKLSSSRLGVFNNRLWGQNQNQNQNQNGTSQDVPDAKSVSIWASAFTQPPVAPKPDTEQIAAMERFRVLLGSVTPPAPILTTLPNQPVAPVVDPNLQVMPEVNPMGGGFTTLKDTSSKPMGIIPLPGIATRPIPVSQKVDPGSPKPPPWLTHQIPAPGSQQRVF